MILTSVPDKAAAIRMCAPSIPPPKYTGCLNDNSEDSVEECDCENCSATTAPSKDESLDGMFDKLPTTADHVAAFPDQLTRNRSSKQRPGLKEKASNFNG